MQVKTLASKLVSEITLSNKNVFKSPSFSSVFITIYVRTNLEFVEENNFHNFLFLKKIFTPPSSGTKST